MLHEMRVKYEMNIDLNLPQHPLNKEVFTQQKSSHVSPGHSSVSISTENTLIPLGQGGLTIGLGLPVM